MHLYCRHCGYDLRGRTEPRCPDCATPLDPADGATFDSQPQTRLGRFMRRVCTRDVIILVIPTLLLIASYAGRLLLPQLSIDREYTFEMTSRYAVGFVIRLWREELKADPPNAQAALDRAFAAAPPAFSFKTQVGRMRARRVWMERCGKTASWTAHLIPYGLLIVLACRRRIAAFGAVVLLASIAIVLVYGFARSNPPLAVQPDRAYLDDYIYLTDVEWPAWDEPNMDAHEESSADAPDAATAPRVAAFEKPPWTDRVTFARADGRVAWLPPDEFRRLAETEGFADRVPP